MSHGDAVDPAPVLRELYTAVLDPGGWQRALLALHDAFPYAKLMLNVDETAPQRCVFELSVNIDPDAAARQVGDYGAINPYIEHAGSLGAGQIARSSDALPMEELLRHPFYAEHLRLDEDTRLACGGIFAKDASRFATLGMLFPNRWIEAQAMQGDALLKRLLPHLQTVHTLAVANAGLLAQRSIETMPLPAIAVDSAGRCLFANAAADRLIASGRGLGVSSDGTPGTDCAVDTRRLESVLLRCLFRGSFEEPIALKRDGFDPLFMTVVPIRRDASLDRLLGVGHSAPPAAIVFLLDPHERQLDSILSMADAFGLTSAETLVVQAVIKGDTLDTVATRRGVARNTIRNKLSSAMQKLGVSRRADLISRFAAAGYGRQAEFAPETGFEAAGRPS